MKKALFILIIASISFLSGFGLKSLLQKKAPKEGSYKKATGIGGIFFKCKDPKKVREWYRDNLGLSINEYGSVFEWRQGADTLKKGFTQWSPFKETTRYFNPSVKDFMINYRVENLELLLKDLKGSGVTILDTVETYDYGKFIHILDIENNKIELWEPNDAAFEKIGVSMGYQTTK